MEKLWCGNKMEHITEQYGEEANILMLSFDELEELEPFLKTLGVRLRITAWYGNTCKIQAENPYKDYSYFDSKVKQLGDKAMSDREIRNYKR